MTATALPPARSTLDAVRTGLTDIRDRVSDIEAIPELERIAEVPRDLIDRATGRRRRRPPWPLVALGVVAVVGIAVGVTMFMLNRSVDHSVDEFESEMGGLESSSGESEANPASANAASSFPASDSVPSPMTPSIGS